MPVEVSLEQLTKEAMVRILSEPKNALTKQYQKLFELDNVKLEFTKEALEEIARLAVERKIGARGLRSILESAIMDLMYEIPSDDSIGICTITKAVIDKTGSRSLYTEICSRQPESLYPNGSEEEETGRSLKAYR